MGMVPDTRINLGFIYAGAHSCAAMDGDIAIQVTCKYPQHKGYRLARRRFVYYWEKDFIDDKWVRHGLAMTDDDGFLFDLKTFFKDTLQKKNSMTGTAHIVDWKIKKFDYNSRKWTSQPWNFFGSTEDVIAFQKWLGTPQLSSLTRENSEEKEYFINSQSFVHLDSNNQPIFRYHFLVPDKYLIKFKPGCDRFFMFCPPDIVNPELLRKQGGSGKPSFSVAGTGSNTDIDFEFLPEPKSEWFKHVYHVKPGDTLSDIAAKYGDTENRFLRVNASVTNPNRIKPGIALNVPRPMTDHDLYSREEFGTFASAGYVHGDVAHEEVLRTDRFPKMQENGRYLHSARILLSTNLEEHLSNLAFHTALLDLQYQQIVESSVPFMEAAGLVRQIGDTLELMHQYPGYKSRVPCPAPGMMPGDYNSSGGGLSTLRVMGGSDNYDSVYYEGKVDANTLEKRKIEEVSKHYQDYAEELSDAVWNSNNPVFKALSEDIYREIDNIEMIVTDREFYRRLEEWAGYELYANDKPEYPFFLKVSVNVLDSGTGLKFEAAPIIYRVIQDAFSLCLSLDFEQKPGKGEKEDTVADAFYKKAVAPFEDNLEMEFIKLDSVQKAKGEKSIGEKVVETAKESGVELFDIYTGSDIVSNQYRLNVQHSKEEATVLQIVFMDLVCKNILKRAPSYLQAVLMASTRCRSAAILAAVDITRQVQASFAHLKVAVGKMVYMGSESKAIALELEEGIREFSRSKKATLQKVYAKKQTARSGSASFGKAPKALSHMSTMVGAAFTIYDIASFSIKYADEKTEVDLKDWIGLTKTLHGGGLLLTKFSFKWIGKHRRVFRPINLKAERFLARTAVVFIWYDAVCFSIEAYNYYADGEEVFAALRSVQALSAFASGTMVLLGVSTPVVAALFAAGYILSEITIKIIKSLRKGVEVSVRDTRTMLNNMQLFDGVVSTFSGDAQYILHDSLSIIHIADATSYRDMTGAIRKWQEIKNLINTISWWNLDMIRAGSVLFSEGYASQEIAFICMKVQERQGLRAVERNWIEYFAENETFLLKNRRKQYEETTDGSGLSKSMQLYNSSFSEQNDKLNIMAVAPREQPSAADFFR